ncbi:acyl carrier protein [Chitinimonas naiadis]
MDTTLSKVIGQEIETLAYLAPGELSSDTALFSAGIIDSLNLIQLVMFVEKQCGIRVPAEDLTLEYWDSVDRIVGYVARRTG